VEEDHDRHVAKQLQDEFNREEHRSSRGSRRSGSGSSSGVSCSSSKRARAESVSEDEADSVPQSVILGTHGTCSSTTFTRQKASGVIRCLNEECRSIKKGEHFYECDICGAVVCSSHVCKGGVFESDRICYLHHYPSTMLCYAVMIVKSSFPSLCCAVLCCIVNVIRYDMIP
jgi:hypothetical protein